MGVQKIRKSGTIEKKKNTENWQYNKLTSINSAEYCRAENDRATKYYYERKLKEQEIGEGLEGIDQIPEEPDRNRQQELSRQR